MSGTPRTAVLWALLAGCAFFANRDTHTTQAATAREDSSQALAQGKKLYDTRCGICHEPGGTGAIMLARRLGKDRSVLATRTDLTSDYIHKIVRVGIGSMPPFSRIEVTNADLHLIAAYLTRSASDRIAPTGQPQARSSSGSAHE